MAGEFEWLALKKKIRQRLLHWVRVHPTYYNTYIWRPYVHLAPTRAAAGGGGRRAVKAADERRLGPRFRPEESRMYM